jgi:pimeloyl-ACP methyl ester carboxylesterase
LPEGPDKIAVKFTLYSRNNPNGIVIKSDFIPFDYRSNSGTKFITHGFLHNGLKKWVMDMKDAILRVENVNVIVVDWSKGNGFPYTQATANTQVVGAEIAKLIKSLVTDKGDAYTNFHLIGHSLGAHISGYAGRYLGGKVGRITGLDPAGPYFENTDPLVRLDPTDAIYVDAIHSDGTANLALGLGLMQPVAHADFYPNGGKDQPGCATTSDKLLGAIFNAVLLSVEGVEESVACSHMAAVHFFTDSIENQDCSYIGYQCNSKSDFESGKCILCTQKGCNRMGYWSGASNDRGLLYLNTQPPSSGKYCKQNFQANLFSQDGGVQARGSLFILFFNHFLLLIALLKCLFFYCHTGVFTIQLKTDLNEQSTVEVLDSSDTTFKKSGVETRLISLNTPLKGKITQALLTYTKTNNLLSSWMYDSTWAFKRIELLFGDKQSLSRLCSTIQAIGAAPVSFTLC